MVESRTQPGRFYAVKLHGVIAESVEHLVPSGKMEPAAYCVERVKGEMDLMHRRREWGSK